MWILIVILSTATGNATSTIAMTEFNNALACNAAGRSAEILGKDHAIVQWACVTKG